ncbi:MAG: class D sortase [bacterium]|jgi:sortase A
MSKLRALEIALWTASAVALALVVWMMADRTVFQAYKEWVFERKLGEQGRQGKAPGERSPAEPHRAPWPLPGPAPRLRTLPPESMVGRVEIPRLGMKALILEGTSSRALRRAVGHIEGTSLPGDGGNTGLAGHRDTFFRQLKNINLGDVIRVHTLDGMFDYVVESTGVVAPERIEVLNATASPALTLVTCYPFSYVGSAPNRFIVRARQVNAVYRSGAGQRAASAPAP